MISFDVISAAKTLTGKRGVLTHIAEQLAAKCGVDKQIVLKALSERERLGSTAMGEGVAMPHSIIEGTVRPYTMLLTLKKGVEFEAIDHKLVTIVFALIAPENHVPTLAKAARMLRDSSLKKRLLKAQDEEELRVALAELE